MRLLASTSWLNSVKGAILVGIGFMLSPLCWWNDLILNIPLAYGFGYLCSKFNQDLLFPGLIVGYWLTNVLGFLLMQFGTFDIIQDQGKRDSRKDLINGLLTSTVFTVAMLFLVQLNVINIPDLSNPEQLLANLKSFWDFGHV
jgi:hypothetical protein